MISVDNVSFKQDFELIGLSRFVIAFIQQPMGMMNIIPISEPNMLPIIYDWGLIRMYHDWYEPHNSTFVFTIYCILITSSAP